MDGKRLFAIEDLTDEDYQVLKKIEIDSVPVNLRARIADILWTQKKEYAFAIDAAESYLELYQTLFNEDDHFLSIKLMEIMLNEKYGDKEKIISIIDKIICNFQTDVNKVQSAYELKIKFLEKIKDNKAIKEANIA